MKNITVKVPKIGDIVCLDQNNDIVFVAFDSFDKASLAKEWTIVGVVGGCRGNQVLLINKTNTTKKWAELFRWSVTGWKLDGTAHTTKISVHPSMPAKPSHPDFTYTATSLDQVVEQFNAWLAVWNEEYPGTGKYSCYVDGEAVKVFVTPHSAWYEYLWEMTGLSVAYDTGAEIPSNNHIYGKNGTNYYYKGMNFEKFYHYLRYEAGKDWWPKEPISSLPYTPFPYDCYISEIGAYARGIYGEGEEGFKKFVADYMVDFPSHRGAIGPDFKDSHHNTYALAGQNIPGTELPAFPAARYCADVEYPNPLLAKNCWSLPSMHLLCWICRILKEDKSDPINRALAAIGGSLLYLAGTWSSARCSDDSAWFFYGSRGCTAVNNLYVSCYCWSCVLLNLNEVNK